MVYVTEMGGDGPRFVHGSFEELMLRVRREMMIPLQSTGDPFGPAYHCYVASLRDASGDGVGDLAGATEALPWLAWLGVQWVMPGPVCPYKGKDGPYSVAEYSNDPELARFCEAAHALGIRVMIDMVGGHTWDGHPWFQRALADPDSPERRMYHIYPADEDLSRFDRVPPSFPDYYQGIWTEYPVAGFRNGRGRVMTLFHDDQPAFDVFGSKEVQRRMLDYMHASVNAGVDGFRLDAADKWHVEPGTEGLARPGCFDVVTHYATELHKRHGRKIPLMAESVREPDKWIAAGASVYDFQEMAAAWHAIASGRWDEYRALIIPAPPEDDEGWWVRFRRNHDEFNPFGLSDGPRMEMLNNWGGLGGENLLFGGLRQRTIDLVRGWESAVVMLTALGLLRSGWWHGYQGDEIAMRGRAEVRGREMGRTPYQWGPWRMAGFTAADSSWLPLGHGWEHYNAWNMYHARESLARRIRDLHHFYAGSPAVQVGVEAFLPVGDPSGSILPLVRWTPGGEALLLLFNALPVQWETTLDLSKWGGPRDARFELGPYGVRVVKLR